MSVCLNYFILSLRQLRIIFSVAIGVLRTKMNRQEPVEIIFLIILKMLLRNSEMSSVTQRKNTVDKIDVKSQCRSKFGESTR